jgi:hypothetical protein
MSRAAERLSDIQCKQAKPRDKAYKLSDGGGLMLREPERLTLLAMGLPLCRAPEDDGAGNLS